MSNEGMKVKKITKENRAAVEAERKRRKEKQDAFDQVVHGKVKFTTEMKKQVIGLNVLQAVLLAIVVLIQVLNEKGSVSDTVAMISVGVLIVSIVVIIAAIRKITNKDDSK